MPVYQPAAGHQYAQLPAWHVLLTMNKKVNKVQLHYHQQKCDLDRQAADYAFDEEC